MLRGSLCLPFLITRLLCRAPEKLREESPVRRFSKMEAVVMFERLLLYPQQQLLLDPVHGHAPWALVLVSLFVGYFLADGVGLLWNQTLGQAWHLLCHYLVVVRFLGITHLSGHYVGFSVMSRLLELNSACLSLRKLLLLSLQAPSLAFIVASWATLATLALCCLVPLGWMSLWLIQQYHQVPPALVVLGETGLVTVSAMSISTVFKFWSVMCCSLSPAHLSLDARKPGAPGHVIVSLSPGMIPLSA